ncbi:MAG TPA: glycosyltransferase [Acetobacteraceae bacterium]|nr:glycosyltransferase [Acetobacteraceae bacterium]
MTVHLDISQLVHDPRRSGIQRVERELIRHWPGPAELLPCVFDGPSNAMRELKPAIFGVLCADATGLGVADEQRRLAPYLASGRVITPERLLSAELFIDKARAAYYRDQAGPVAFWLVYDFLPWLQPEWYAAGPAAAMMPYLQAMRSVRHLAFISEATRRDCVTRILRRPVGGPVIPLGADGLGLERQRFDPGRRDIVVLGAIEPRKNAAPVMLAFRRLWAEGSHSRLIMIGAPEKDALEERALLRELAGDDRFRHFENLPDAGVRAALSGARALLFPSVAEGYGLPPTEALASGVPVIVSAGLPALQGMPALGQVRLDAINPETIADAVRLVMDDAEARRLWDGAAGMRLPTWRRFAAAVADWVQASPTCPRPPA